MKPKKVSALIILFVAVAVSYFLINGSQKPSLLSVPKLTPLISSQKEALPPKEVSLKDSPTKTPLVEQLSELKPSFPYPELSQEKINSQNLTQKLNSAIAQEILKKNEGGPEIIEGKQWINTLKDNELNLLFDQILTDFNLGDLKPHITDKELIIIEDNSKAALERYFQQTQKALRNSFKNNVFTENNLNLSDQKRLEMLNQWIALYEPAISNLYKIPVPSSLKEIHKKGIQLVITQKIIWEYIRAFNEDPLKTILAFSYLEDLDQDFSQLNQIISQLIKEKELNILL